MAAFGDLDEPACRLAALPEVTGPEQLDQALSELEAARELAHDARRRTHALDPAHPLDVGMTGVLAAREAAWSCAGAAAWAAARLGIGDEAGDRARAAARSASGDAAVVAIRARGVPGGHAGRAAARAALEPTLAGLADSALALLDRMLPTELPCDPGRRAPYRTRSPPPPGSPWPAHWVRGGPARPTPSQHLDDAGGFLHVPLTPARRTSLRMDFVAVLLGVLVFSILLALIAGIDRI